MKGFDGKDIAWQPFPIQRVAMACPARELLYGGEKGGAKTSYLVAAPTPLLTLAHEKHLATGRPQMKCRNLIFRKNLDNLKDAIAKSFDIYPYLDPQMGATGYNKVEKTWHFTSGATVEFRHLDGPTDHLGFNGNEIPGLYFDELQFIPYDAYSFLVAQCRSGDPDYHNARIIRGTANPGGFDWIIPYFGIDKCAEGGKIFRHVVENRDGSKHEVTRAFVRARLRDNPHLPPDYEAQLRATMSEDEIAMYLEGDFFRVAGSFFSRLLRPSMHFQKSRPIPSTWEFIHGIDWGSTNPASWHLGAIDPADSTLYIIDELHKPGVAGSVFGEALHEKFQRQKWCSDRIFKNGDFWGVIDKQAMDEHNGPETAAAGIMEWGFRLFPAKKDRVPGCNQMKERLLMNRHGKPQLVIFEDRCPELVKALSGIPSNAPKDPEEYNPDSHFAHACDSLRFICMEHPVRPTRQDNPVDAEVARWDRLLRTRKGSTNNAGMAGYGD